MARVQTLGQRCPYGGKMLVRGTFTQKKKVWDALDNIAEEFGIDLKALELFNDVTEKRTNLTYGGLCEMLRVNGRATIVAADGSREFQIIDGDTNVLRGWDVNDEGPVCNPVVK